MSKNEEIERKETIKKEEEMVHRNIMSEINELDQQPNQSEVVDHEANQLK